jgi:hypothetical protein
MSDTLLGVIIGGAIAILGQSISLFINHIKWKKENRIRYLQSKRQKLEEIFKKINEELSKGIENNNYSWDTITDVFYLCPNIVVDAFSQFMQQKDESSKNNLSHLDHITAAMKVSLSEIDSQIEKLII